MDLSMTIKVVPTPGRSLSWDIYHNDVLRGVVVYKDMEYYITTTRQYNAPVDNWKDAFLVVFTEILRRM